MGIGVIVHGYIRCPGWGNQAEDNRIFQHNHKVIQQLPLSDPQWPFLTREMFSMLPLRTSLEQCIPQYESQIIHFAGSYKDMYTITAGWLTKFEDLLSKLCWFSASAMTEEKSHFKYDWRVVVSKELVEQYQNNPPKPPQSWTFQCKQLEERAIDVHDGIDGEFKSLFHKPANLKP